MHQLHDHKDVKVYGTGHLTVAGFALWHNQFFMKIPLILSFSKVCPKILVYQAHDHRAVKIWQICGTYCVYVNFKK